MNHSQHNYPQKIHPKTRIMGYSITTSNSRPWEMGASWQRFLSEGMSRVPANSSEIYAIYYDYEGDHTQNFKMLVGCPVSDDAFALEGMEIFEIPSQSYLEVISEGPMPQAIAQTWQKIWQESTDGLFKRSWTHDFQIHNLATPERVQVLLAVQ